MFNKRFLRNAFLMTLVSAALLSAGCSKTAPTAGKDVPNQTAAGDVKGFEEFPIGDEQKMNGLNIALVYFQPVLMVPEAKAGLKPTEADMHLEADISSDANNKTGFGAGEFVPYLQVNYTIKNMDSGATLEGTMMPMNASDGPHYGSNIKMPGGAGTYKITLKIKAPDTYLLHHDKVTGVEGQWWETPIEANFDFKYVPRKW